MTCFSQMRHMTSSARCGEGGRGLSLGRGVVVQDSGLLAPPFAAPLRACGGCGLLFGLMLDALASDRLSVACNIAAVVKWHQQCHSTCPKVTPHPFALLSGFRRCGHVKKGTNLCASILPAQKHEVGMIVFQPCSVGRLITLAERKSVYQTFGLKRTELTHVSDDA